MKVLIPPALRSCTGGKVKYMRAARTSSARSEAGMQNATALRQIKSRYRSLAPLMDERMRRQSTPNWTEATTSSALLSCRHT